MMKSIRKLVLLGFALLVPLFAYSQTSSQNDYQLLTGKLNAFQLVGKQCSEKIKESPVFEKVNDVLIIGGTNSPNKLEILGSTKKLNSVEKQNFKEYINLSNSLCRQPMMEIIQGAPHQKPWSEYFNTMDSVYAKLYAGQITVGQASEAKLNAITKRVNEYNEFSRQMQQQANQAMQNQRQYQQNQQSSQQNNSGNAGALMNQGLQMLAPPGGGGLNCTPNAGGPSFGPTAGSMTCR